MFFNKTGELEDSITLSKGEVHVAKYIPFPTAFDGHHGPQRGCSHAGGALRGDAIEVHIPSSLALS